MASALITIEGVLAASRTPEEPVVRSQPISAGKALYEALSSVWRLVVITAETDGEGVLHFLAQEGLTRHALVATLSPYEKDKSLEAATLRHLEQQRSLGAVGLLVTPSPQAAAETMKKGCPTLLFVPPIYARPEWRPDHHKVPKQWDAIEAEVTRQRALRAADRRNEPV